MKCLIISFFNSSNIGDCILSDRLYRNYESKYDCEKISYTLNPFEYMDLNNIKKIGLSDGSIIKDFVLKLLSNMKLYFLIYPYYKEKKYHNSSDFSLILKKIEKSDVVIIGGGNMLFDLTDQTLSAARLNYYINLAKRHHKPIHIVNIGIGPFSNKIQEREAIKVLEKANFVSFRDKKSYDLYTKFCKKNNGYLSADAAFYDISKIESKKSYITLNIIEPDLFTNVENKKRIKNNYMELINLLLSKTNYDVCLYNTELRDIDFLNEIYNEISFNRVFKKDIYSYSDLVNLYHKSLINIGSRMHSIIIPFTFLIPSVGLSWQTKVDGLFELLNMEQYVYSIINLDIINLVDVIINIINNQDTYHKKLEDGLKTINNLLKVNNDFIENLQKNNDKEITNYD